MVWASSGDRDVVARALRLVRSLDLDIDNGRNGGPLAVDRRHRRRPRPRRRAGRVDIDGVHRAVPADRPVHRRLPAAVPRRPLRLLGGGPLVVGRRRRSVRPRSATARSPAPCSRPATGRSRRGGRCLPDRRVHRAAAAVGRRAGRPGRRRRPRRGRAGSPSGSSTGSAPSPTTSCAGWIPTATDGRRRRRRPTVCSASITLPPGETTRIELLGPVRLLVDGDVVERPEQRRARVRELLAVLTIHPTLGRERAMDLLWPDLGDGRCRPQPAGHADPPPTVPRTGPRAGRAGLPRPGRRRPRAARAVGAADRRRVGAPPPPAGGGGRPHAPATSPSRSPTSSASSRCGAATRCATSSGCPSCSPRPSTCSCASSTAR